MSSAKVLPNSVSNTFALLDITLDLAASVLCIELKEK